ncbi:MAG: hypothetical protein WD045_07050 [Pirellulaceae bacterium]
MAEDQLYKAVLDKLDAQSGRLERIESNLAKIGDLGSRVESIERLGSQIPAELERLKVRDEEREKSIGWSNKLIYGLLLTFLGGVGTLVYQAGNLGYQTAEVDGNLKVALEQIKRMEQSQVAQGGTLKEYQVLLTENQDNMQELVSAVQQLREDTRKDVEQLDHRLVSLVKSHERHRDDLATTLAKQGESVTAAIADLKEVQATTREAIVSWSETSRSLAELIRTNKEITQVTITRRLSEANLTPGKSLRYSFSVDLDSGMDSETIRVVDVAIIQIESDLDKEVSEGVVSFGSIDRENRRIRINVMPVSEKYASMLEKILGDGHIVANVTLANFPVPTDP